MFSSRNSVIAIDFGTASVKLLQTVPSSGSDHNARPQLAAAAELALPVEVRADARMAHDYVTEHLPPLIRKAGFKGRRVVCSVPCHQTHVQHMQLSLTNSGAKPDIAALVKMNLETQYGWSSESVVVRYIEVADILREGQPLREVISFAMTRETVMKYVDLLSKAKMEVVGVHGEQLTLLRSFEHLHRRREDETVSTVYIDLGWGGTKIAISRGRDLVFSRSIAIGGRHFDEQIAGALACELSEANEKRLAALSALSESEAGSACAAAGNTASAAAIHAASASAGTDGPVDSHKSETATVVEERRTGERPAELAQTVPHVQDDGNGQHAQALPDDSGNELIATLCDELSMCSRYHERLFPGRRIDRAIFLGGEARDEGLCRRLAEQVKVPAFVGDPLARLRVGNRQRTPGVDLTQPQPGWAVCFGLCSAPTDM